MIVVPLSSENLARVRWAPSPIFETLAWLRLTADRRHHPRLGDPGPAARFALRHPDVAMIAAVVRGVGGYMPDLFTPKPLAGRTAHVLDEQLAAVGETTPQTVHAQYEVAASYTGTAHRKVRHALDSSRFARRVASGLHAFWRTALCENWRGIDEALTADVHQRATVMAGHGVGVALDTLHREIRWHGDSLQINIPCAEVLLSRRYPDLVLAPSILSGPHFSAQVTDPDNSVITYPVARLLNGGAQRRPPTASLLGRTRAAILASIDVPRSTTELGRRHSLAVSTVSHHLGVLLEAGLAVKVRRGRYVHYARTARGDALCD